MHPRTMEQHILWILINYRAQHWEIMQDQFYNIKCVVIFPIAKCFCSFLIVES
jgi:hypothetical protein